MLCLSFSLQDRDVRSFLEEATLMDPRRFRYRLEEDVVWERLKRRAVAANTVEAVAEVLFEAIY